MKVKTRLIDSLPAEAPAKTLISSNLQIFNLNENTLQSNNSEIGNIQNFEIFEFEENYMLKVYLFAIRADTLLLIDENLLVLNEFELPPGIQQMTRNTAIILKFQDFVIHIDHITAIEIIHGVHHGFSKVFVKNTNLVDVVPLATLNNSLFYPIKIDGGFKKLNHQNRFILFGDPFVEMRGISNQVEHIGAKIVNQIRSYFSKEIELGILILTLKYYLPSKTIIEKQQV